MAAGSSALGFSASFTSTNAHGAWTVLGATTVAGTAPGVVIPSSATAVFVTPVHSTNVSTQSIRVGMSTAATTASGTPLGYRGASLINVESTFETTMHFYTSGASTVTIRVGVI